MFEPECTGYVYFYQPFLNPYKIEEHFCKIGPDVDLLGRKNRWLAEDIKLKRFGKCKLTHVEVPKEQQNRVFVGMSRTKQVYICCWSLLNTDFDPKKTIDRYYDQVLNGWEAVEAKTLTNIINIWDKSDKLKDALIR